MSWITELAKKIILGWFRNDRNPPGEHEVSGYYRVNPETGKKEWVSSHKRGGQDV